MNWSWSARWSRAYCRAAWPPNAQHEKIMASLEAFVLWKEAFLRRLKAKGISIPKKSKKDKPFLNTSQVFWRESLKKR